MKRPLLPVVLVYVCGILLAQVVVLPVWPILITALCLTILAIWATRLRAILLPILLLLAGLDNTLLHTATISPRDLRQLLGTEPHLVTLRGDLVQTPALRVYDEGENSRARTLARIRVTALRLDKKEWQPAFGQMAVTSPGHLTNFSSGQVLEVFGVAGLPRTAAADGTFDYRKYLQQQGIYYQLTTESEKDWRLVWSPPGPPLADWFSSWAREALALGLPAQDEALRLEWALALGWKTALTEEAMEPFVRAATYHIFAVDGLRMAIVFGIFFGVLRVIGLSRPVCGVLLIPLIWFYVALTGWPASAIRASVMLTIIIVGWVLRRPGNSVNSLLFAALVILVWEPQQLFQAGFQLSFFVVLALILILPPLLELINRLMAPDPFLPAQLRRRLPPILAIPGRYFADLTITSFAAWIGSLPLVACYFNIVTPVSTPANIIAVPLCVLVLISNLLSLIFAACIPGVAELFNHAGWFGMECIRVSSVWFANWPAAYWYTPAPNWFTILLYYALLLGITTGWLIQAKHRAWKIAAVSLLAFAWIFLYVRQATVSRLTVLPVSGGTAIFVDAPGRSHDLLVDVGPTNSVRFITQPFLRAQGVNRLPSLLLSHGDVHHLGGTEPLLEQFGASQVYTTPARFRSSVCRKMMDRLSNTYGVERLSRGQRVSDWLLLHPEVADQFSRADDATAVLSAMIKGTRVLLLSDLGREGQNALLNRTADLRADIVIAGQPAQGEPLCDALIEAIHPRLIIISDSEFPASERASPELRARLQRRTIPTLYTRETGSVTLEFRNHCWKLKTASGLSMTS